MNDDNHSETHSSDRGGDGAVHGHANHEQPNSWEITKTDVASEAEIREEVEEEGEAPASRADEAHHGPVCAQPPAEFTGLRVTEVQEVAAGMKAVQIAMEYVVDEMGPIKGPQMLRRLNQVDGFDCAGCAWPDPAPGERSVAEFCENGAKATAEENTTKRVTPEFFRQHSVAELSEKSDYWLAKQGRISQPMVLRTGATHYEPISWEESFRMVADELNRLDSPDEAIFYTSGRTANETAFLYQLFIREFGTNNLPDCSNMCHESSGTALTETLGIGKGTVTLDDVTHTDLLISIGQNPGSCHPRMLTALRETKQNGGRIIAVNPLPETGLNRFQFPQDVLQVLTNSSTQLADLFVPVRINGDVAFLKGVMKEMLDDEDRRPGTVFDHAFIREHTSGFDAFIEDLRAESWDVITEQSGISRKQIREVAEMVMRKERVIISWAMGLTQHKNAVGTIQECVNLLLLKGSMGKPGAGALPVRGHSNVQGDRTMGIWERPADEFLDRLGREFDLEPPRHHGYDTVEAIKAMHAGKGKVFFAMGGNFISATPDTEYTAEAMRRCRLTAQVSIKLNRGHLVTGEQALILPTVGRSERDVQESGPQFVTVENSMGIVSKSEGRLPPASEHLLSEPTIVARLARATLGERSKVRWEWLVDDYDRVRTHIANVIPGFDDYNERVREPGGFYLPNLPRDRREFRTETGKAMFTVHPIPEHKLEPGQLVMMTVRSHDQFNTTVYGLHDRYRGIHNERRVVMMNPDDIREQGLEPGQVVDLTSHHEGETRVARRFIIVAYPIPRRCAATYFPETNVLVPIDSVAERSNTPVSKFIVMTVAPAEDASRWDYDRAAEAQMANA